MTKLKSRIAISTTLDRQLAALLDELSEKTQIPKSKLHDQAIRLLLQKYGMLSEK